MIKSSSLEQLKQQIDIVDVISNSIELRKSGANFKACCPFHGEATPSFVISPTKQIYHCFGCGVGGDAIKFVQEYQKVNFQEAVEKIANDMNFTLEYEDNYEKKDYQTIFEVVNKFYEDSLNDEHINYLLSRGLTLESIKKFELGFAPRSDKQIEYMKSQFLNIEDSIEIGILAVDKDKLYARQRERITFPIRNHLNKLIGFGGRTLKDSKEIAKYINSPETKLYNKSKVFYGFNFAKDNIYKKSNIVIVEGNLDVIMMHQIGIDTAVATMGTALTKEHISQIKKANAKAILCFDGDNAGKKAALSASILLSQSEIDAGVVIFENGLDPADMIKNNRSDEIKELLSKPVDSIKYVLKYIVGQFDLKKAIEKNKALSESVEFLLTLNRVIAEEYKEFLSSLLSIKAYHINLSHKKDNFTNEKDLKSELSLADEKILKTIMTKPDFLDIMFNKIDYEAFENNKYFKAYFDKDEDTLRPIEIRDDIIIYNREDFSLACKLKQKDYLKKELEKLIKSTDDDVFAKIDHLSKKIDSLR